MRIAVCFSGQWRTGNNCYNDLKEFFGILYPSCDFFIHTWDINKQKCYNLSNVFSRETKLYEDEIETINQNYKPKKIVIENYASVRDELKIFNIVQPLWYSFYKSVELKKEFEKENSFEYDYVIKLRPDVFFNYNRKLSQDIELYEKDLNSGKIYIENLARDYSINTNTVDDVYFLSNTKSMNIVSEYYLKWVNWGLAFGSENFYGFIKHCILNGVKMCDFKQRYFGGETGYVVLRPECLEYTSIYDKCIGCEDYYYGNPNKNSMTPEGYYISLLKDKYIIDNDVEYYIDELKEK